MHAVIECEGHPAITGTHAKTWELTLDPDITRRATCVVGVGAAVDWHRLLAMRGPVRFTLSVDNHRDVVRAEINPLFRAGPRLVVRTSRFRAADTLAVGADKASADLDRALVGALARPGSQLHVEVSPEASRHLRARGLLAVLPAGSGFGELVERADAVRTLGGRERGTTPEPPVEEMAAALGEGGLVCVVLDAAGDEAAATGMSAAAGTVPAGLAACIAEAVNAGADVVAAPGPATLMAAIASVVPDAAAGPEGHVMLMAADKTPASERRAMVATASVSPWPVVWSGTPSAVRRVVELVGGTARERPACVAVDEGEGLVRISPCRVAGAVEALPAPRRGERAPVAFVMAGAPGPGDETRATVQELLAALAGAGVSARTLRDALEQVPGVASAWSYDELARLAREARR